MDAILGALIVQLLLAQAQLERLAILHAEAAEIHVPLFDREHPEIAIYFWADFYHQSRYELYHTLKDESQFDPKAVGPYGERGLCQIYLAVHPYVSIEQAEDPDWCIPWTARMWAKGHAHWWVAHWKFEK